MSDTGAQGPEGPEQQDPPRPPWGDLAKMETWVDLTIQQAQRRGDFDNLPGAGAPLRDLDRPYDPDWWVKQLVERERLDLTAALPGAMALRREKRAFPESLLGLADEAAVRERLEDFNERVLADRRTPVTGPASPPVVGRVDVEAMVSAWRVLRAGREATRPLATPDPRPPAGAAGRPRAARRRRLPRLRRRGAG